MEEPERSRSRYRIDPTTWSSHPVHVDAAIRRVTTTDRQALAELMLDAYRGTIDDEGETLDDALDEVDDFFGSPWFPEHSWTVEADGRPVSACLVAEHDGTALIAFVITDPRSGRGGLARALVDRSLDGLARSGCRTVELYITDGNEPSERLFADATRID